ncbi:subunit of the COMPASS (Set1C) histone methyltansferase complex, putative [Candida dubliniensis CD36]|uniref:Subunit of the COMPASS (Set1C) histone methyltansferase complex, putative n=1 Tax=Candida dubliniensis (strain CD36 / ATCC MYA-646 / CBS 7987 / NCPF 3949 / NRRL Y-17841) TaxID=573826 RepID=B9WI21_CANDC|nr:subunit of the COMPASS (Set1C) histone methyltansferase complex, putative [Candida dubliniensis CD36]CAX41818.1 subunit of the COMPASS (Set1C) histone methyltansferase complex, putative [Candida dubliniensis CD36]
MNKETSEEPSIEPQVQGNESIEETQSEHTYSTRSKERKREEELQRKSQLKQKQHNVIIHPRLKPVPFKNSDLIPVSLPEPNAATTINEIEFFQTEDLPLNKRGFKYKHCRPNPNFPSNLYSTTDVPPYHVCTSLFDRSSGVLFSNDLKSITTSQGWRSARTNVCIREGSYYFEFKILNSNEKSHVRIGIGRKEASLEAPVGFDGYSYGLRDVDGQFMTISRRQKLCVENGFKTGDVIGFLIQLPSLEEHRRAIEEFVNEKSQLQPEQKLKKRKKKKIENDIKDNVKFIEHGNIVRDQIPIKYKNGLYYEQYEYTTTKTMEHLLNPVTVFGEKAIIEMDDKRKNIPVIPNSKIRLFKNGVEQESIIDLYSFLPTNIEDHEDINLGPNTKQQQNPNYRNTDDGTLGYYPMLSAFQYGVVNLNAGPNFEFPPSEPVKPLSDRYNEQVVEQFYWDILDEVEAEYLDSFDL